MAKKIGDLSSKEREAVTDVISCVESVATEKSEMLVDGINKFGLCGTCGNVQYCATHFNIRVARCSHFKIGLSTQYPIETCNSYYENGQMSLYDMKNIAWIIDIPKEVGFLKE